MFIISELRYHSIDVTGIAKKCRELKGLSNSPVDVQDDQALCSWQLPVSAHRALLG